jgi:REP element-mobilizing transposase RayT
MNLSDNGIIVKEQWSWLGKQYPYIELISFIIMPDHVHGIIHINSDYYKQCKSGMDGINYVGNGRDRSLHSIQPHPTKQIIPTIHPHPTKQIIPTIQPHPTKQTIPKIKPLPELIGAFKTTAAKRIHLSGDTMFKWQKSYYENIIRNNRALNFIKHYIETNPEHWL